AELRSVVICWLLVTLIVGLLASTVTNLVYFEQFNPINVSFNWLSQLTGTRDYNEDILSWLQVLLWALLVCFLFVPVFKFKTKMLFIGLLLLFLVFYVIIFFRPYIDDMSRLPMSDDFEDQLREFLVIIGIPLTCLGSIVLIISICPLKPLTLRLSFVL